MSTHRTLILGAISTMIVLVSVYLLYASAHYMTRIDFAIVKDDDRPVPADISMGQPTENEAEASMLVHVSATGDYIFES